MRMDGWRSERAEREGAVCAVHSLSLIPLLPAHVGQLVKVERVGGGGVVGLGPEEGQRGAAGGLFEGGEVGRLRMRKVGSDRVGPAGPALPLCALLPGAGRAARGGMLERLCTVPGATEPGCGPQAGAWRRGTGASG